MNYLRLALILLMVPALGLAVAACGGGPPSDSVSPDDDDDDSAAGDDDSAIGDDDDSSTPAANLLSLALSSDVSSLTTRQTVEFQVLGSYDDGTSQDLTTLADYSSSDEAVLKVYIPGVGQPLGSGTATVTASLGTLVAKVDLEITVVTAVAGVGDLVVNEVMVDPNGLDINDDGISSTVGDEFVEIANASDVTIDISNIRIYDVDNATPRHTFPTGTILRAGEAIVVFGGGDVAALSEIHASFQIAANNDPGLLLGLALSNGGDSVRLVAPDDTTDIASLSYDAATAGALVGASLTLSDPEVYGTTYVPHNYVPGHFGNYSPGTLLDGSAFPGPDGVYGAP
jgi:hypothetical protein